MIDPTASPSAVRDALLDAALLHVPFDGWTETTFRAAVCDMGASDEIARAVCPRGALDLAVAFHKRGDAAMRDRLRKADLSVMKIREKVTFAVRARLEAIVDKEAVRRGSTLFALPQNAAEGAQADLGHGGRDLGRAGRSVGRYQLVHQARDAGRGLCRDGAVLAGRRIAGV